MLFSRYSHGEKVKGAYHCQFGVVERGTASGQKINPVFIRGLELTGSVRKMDNYSKFTMQLISRSEILSVTVKSTSYAISCRSRMELQKLLSR